MDTLYSVSYRSDGVIRYYRKYAETPDEFINKFISHLKSNGSAFSSIVQLSQQQPYAVLPADYDEKILDRLGK